MRDDTKHRFWDSWTRLKALLRELLIWRVVIRQKFGAEVLALPVLAALFLMVIAPQFAIIAVLVLVVVGYRISFERR